MNMKINDSANVSSTWLIALYRIKTQVNMNDSIQYILLLLYIFIICVKTFM